MTTGPVFGCLCAGYHHWDVCPDPKGMVYYGPVMSVVPNKDCVHCLTMNIDIVYTGPVMKYMMSDAH